ncbi:hypothetical protein Bhyg_10850, partial [Pseudolycoriella hygida]
MVKKRKYYIQLMPTHSNTYYLRGWHTKQYVLSHMDPVMKRKFFELIPIQIRGPLPKGLKTPASFNVFGSPAPV